MNEWLLFYLSLRHEGAAGAGAFKSEGNFFRAPAHPGVSGGAGLRLLSAGERGICLDGRRTFKAKRNGAVLFAYPQRV